MKSVKFLALFSLVLLLRCGSEEIVCPQRTQKITIDGLNDDWQGALTYYEDQKVALGSCHDENYIYLCLLTTDKSLQMQILHSGLTIWFGEHKGKKEKLGLHYPLGSQKMGKQEMKISAGRPDDQDDDSRKARMLLLTSEMELLDANKKILQRMPAGEHNDINVRINDQEGTLIYELAVPLRKTHEHPFAIATEPGQKVSLALDIAAPKMNSNGDRRPRPGSREGGMRGGRGGGMDDGMDGNRPGGMGGERQGSMGGGPGGGRGRRGDAGEFSSTMQSVQLELMLNLTK